MSFSFFEAVSELKVNLLKSKIIPIGDVDDAERLVGIFGSRGGGATNEIFGTSFGGAIQVNYYKEWYCRKDGQTIRGLEEAVFAERRKVDVDQKYFIQFTHLFSLFPIPMGVANRIWEIAKRFLMGRY
jgi:hypothetical protein